MISYLPFLYACKGRLLFVCEVNWGARLDKLLLSESRSCKLSRLQIS